MQFNKLFSLIIICLFLTSTLVSSSATPVDLIIDGEFVITDTYSVPSNLPSTASSSASADEDLSLQYASTDYTRYLLLNEIGAGQVELYNSYDSPVDISDYRFEYTSGNGSEVEIDISSIVSIPAGGYLVIDDTNSGLTASTFDLTSGILELKAKSWGAYDDVVAWGHLGKAPSIAVGSSISRSGLTPYVMVSQTEFVVANDWGISTTLTFGAVNDVVAPDLGLSSIILSELFSNGSDSFIELVNVANVSAEVEGYTLYVNSSLVHTYVAETLDPSETTTLNVTDSVLTPTGNMYLYNSTGARVCQMGWNDLIANFSLSRFFDYDFYYPELDNVFVNDPTVPILGFRTIVIDKYDWNYTAGYTAQLSGFAYSEPSRDTLNVNTLEIHAANYSEFKTVRRHDVPFWMNQTTAPVLGFLNVSVFNNGSLTIPFFTLHTYFDGGITSPDPTVSKIPFFNWTNIEYDVTDLAPDSWYNVTIMVTAQQNGTAHNVNFITMNNIVISDSQTYLDVIRAKARVEGYFNPSRFKAGDDFLVNISLTNTGTDAAENVTITLRPEAVDSFELDRLTHNDTWISSPELPINADRDKPQLNVTESVFSIFGFKGTEDIFKPLTFVKISFNITYFTVDLPAFVQVSKGYVKIFILSPSFFNPFAWENPFSFVIWILIIIFSLWWISRWFIRASKPKPRPEPTEYVYPEDMISEPGET
jgi:hypothetical protein